MDEIIALERVVLAEVLVAVGIGDDLVQEIGLRLQAGGAPVGQLAVETMIALIDRRVRIEREVLVDGMLRKGLPLALRGRRLRGLARAKGKAGDACEQLTIHALPSRLSSGA